MAYCAGVWYGNRFGYLKPMTHSYNSENLTGNSKVHKSAAEYGIKLIF